MTEQTLDLDPETTPPEEFARHFARSLKAIKDKDGMDVAIKWGQTMRDNLRATK